MSAELVDLAQLLNDVDSLLSWARARQSWPQDVKDEMGDAIARVRRVLTEPHVVEFREDGWSVAHPATCRRELLDCAVHRMLVQDTRSGMPVEHPGRYVVTLGSEGPKYEETA